MVTKAEESIRTSRGELGNRFPRPLGWLFLCAFYLHTQERDNVGYLLV